MASIQDRLARVVERTQTKFPNFMLQTQVLRRLVPLSSTRNNYQISMKFGNGNNPYGDTGEEIFLDDNDAFVMCGIALRIQKVNPSTTPPQYGNFQPFTYPDPQVFVGAPAGQAVEWSALMTIYNGNLSFRTNTLQRIKPMSCVKFLFVPPKQVINAQATVADTGVSNGQTNASLAEYGGWDWESQGFIELLPSKILDGSENNQFELLLANGSTTALDGSYAADGEQDAATRNYLSLEVYGVLIPDGSKAAKEFATSWDLQK